MGFLKGLDFKQLGKYMIIISIDKKIRFEPIIERLDQDMGFLKDQNLTLINEIFKIL